MVPTHYLESLILTIYWRNYVKFMSKPSKVLVVSSLPIERRGLFKTMSHEPTKGKLS